MEHRAVERKDGGDTKKGGERGGIERKGKRMDEKERQSTETSRAVSRLALLHNFIALSPVFATGRKKGRKEGKGAGVLLFPSKEFLRT